ncbi:MAG: hypothetical protein AAF666_09540 [Pseudomonadota bacterium]
MKPSLRPPVLKAALGFLILLFATAAGYGVLDGVTPELGGDEIITTNHAFLVAALNASGDDQIILTELLAILSIVQSAELGFDFFVSANIDVGQALTALTTSIERAWLAVAATAVITELLIGLAAIADAMTPVFFVIAFAATGAYFLALAACTSHLKHVFRSLAEVASSILLVAHLLIPYSIQVSAMATQTVIAGVTSERRESMHHMHGELSALTQTGHDFAGWSEKDQAESAYHVLRKDIVHRVGLVQRFAIELIAHILLTGLVLPLASFAILWFGIRVIFRRIAADLSW